MTIRTATHSLSRSVFRCLAILLCLLLLPIQNSKAEVIKPAVFLDDNEQALILFDYPRDEKLNSYFWLHGDEIRFIHCPDTYYYLASPRLYRRENFHYKWCIGQEKVEYLGEAPVLSEIKQTGPSFLRTNSFLQTNGYILFEFSLELGTFYFYDGNDSQVLGSVRKPEGIGNNPFAFVESIIYDEDNMIVMMIAQPDELPLLYIYEISSGESDLIKDLDIKTIAPYKPGELLVYHEGAIKPYSLKDGSMGRPMAYADEPVDIASRSFAYDHYTGTLYFLLNGDLHRLRSDGNAECIVVAPTFFYRPYGESKFVPSKDEIKWLLPLPNGQLAYTISNELYIINPTPAQGEVESLVLFTHTPEITDATAFYHLTNPHLSIEKYSDITIYGVEDPWCDVFQLGSNYDNFQDFFREGYAMDLTEAPSVLERFGTYIPAVQKTISYQGKPMGVPISMTINPWYVNLVKWKEYGLPDLPTTTEELFHIIDVWAKEYAEKNLDVYLICDADILEFSSCVMYMLLEQYMLECTDDGEPLCFDTELFMSLLEKAFEMPDLPTEWDGEDGSYPLLYGSAYVPSSYFSLYEIGNTVLTDNEELISLGSAYVPIMPVSVSGTDTAKLGAGMDILCIYSNAPNPERAREYLAFVADHPELSQTDLAFMLSPEEHAIQVARVDMMVFYLQHIDDISFDSYALFGPSMRGDVINTLHTATASYLEATGYTIEEAMQKITGELNAISHIGIRSRDH